MQGATPSSHEWIFTLPDGRSAGIGYDPLDDIAAFTVEITPGGNWSWVELLQHPAYQTNQGRTAIELLTEFLARINSWLRRQFGGEAPEMPTDESELDLLLRVLRSGLEYEDNEVRPKQ